MRKSVEDLLTGSGEVLGSTINQNTSFTSEKNSTQPSPQPRRRCPSPGPGSSGSPKRTSSSSSTSAPPNRREQSKSDTLLNVPYIPKLDSSEDSLNKSSDSKLTSPDHNLSPLSSSQQDLPHKSISKVSERAKRKAWYSVLYPSYKSRSEDFKKLFKDVPDDERLIVDYSCAIQRDILVHGRLYVSQNYLCFYANIFRWETCLSVKWKDVTSVTKEKTARVIPNAILVCTQNEKHFLTSFTTRDKAYLMLFRVWQNALMGRQMQPQEQWQWVHNCYGDELGLTSDDEDYIDPYEGKEDKVEALFSIPKSKLSTKSADCLSDEKNSNDTSIENLIETSNLNRRKLLKEENNIKVRPNYRLNRLVTRDDSVISQCDQLPTDMSDSSDSEPSKINLINQAECTSMHEGRQLVHIILPIKVENLFSLILSKSKFLLDFHKARKTTDMSFGEWATDEEGKQVRIVKLTVALTQPVGPKTSQVTETQVLRSCSKPGELYSVDQSSVNAGIPYADSFYVTQHYCLTRTVDDHTLFSVHAEIKYKKSVWGVVKGFIEKNAWNGLEDFYTALVRALQSEYCIPPAKAKARRTRRGGTLQQKSVLEESRGSIKQSSAHHLISDIKYTNEPILEKKGKYESLSWFVIILLFSLIILNVILYVKLWSLETKTIQREKLPNFSDLKDPPKSHEDWLKILQQQEVLHTTEMVKWQKVLQTAIELLRKTENALGDLRVILKIDSKSSPPSSILEESYAEVSKTEL